MKRLISFLYDTYNKLIIIVIKGINLFGLVSFYEPVPQLKIRVGKKKTMRAVERWNMIEREIPLKPMSVLDIGCNVGYYSINLAEKGHFVTALDNRFFASIVYYEKEALKLKQLSSFCMKLSPANIDALPKYDCVFLLSVFHHWCREYGSEAAMKMLDVIYTKTNRMLFFETGQTDSASEKYRKALPNMGDDPEKWMHQYFSGKGCTNVKTLGNVRDRYLILVNK